jgi:hypothetical protein
MYDEMGIYDVMSTYCMVDCMVVALHWIDRDDHHAMISIYS